jgi:hypothetical protein
MKPSTFEHLHHHVCEECRCEFEHWWATEIVHGTNGMRFVDCPLQLRDRVVCKDCREYEASQEPAHTQAWTAENGQ